MLLFLEFKISLGLSELGNIVVDLILDSIAIALELLYLLPLTFLLSDFILQSLSVQDLLISFDVQLVDVLLHHSVLHKR